MSIVATPAPSIARPRQQALGLTWAMLVEAPALVGSGATARLISFRAASHATSAAVHLEPAPQLL